MPVGRRQAFGQKTPLQFPPIPYSHLRSLWGNLLAEGVLAILDLYDGDGLAGLALAGLIGNGAGDGLQVLGGRQCVPDRLGIGGTRPLYRVSYSVSPAW